MSDVDDTHNRLIPDQPAQRILARAIEFDAALDAHVSQARLRDVARDAGIAPDHAAICRQSLSGSRRPVAGLQLPGTNA